jgi:hypothetical protein
MTLQCSAADCPSWKAILQHAPPGIARLDLHGYSDWRATVHDWTAGVHRPKETLPHSEAMASKPDRRDRHGAMSEPLKLEHAGAQRRWSPCTASIPCLHCDGHRRGEATRHAYAVGGWRLQASNPCRRRLQECQGRDRSADTPVAKTHSPRLATSFSMIATTSEVLKYGPSVRCPAATPPPRTSWWQSWKIRRSGCRTGWTPPGVRQDAALRLDRLHDEPAPCQFCFVTDSSQSPHFARYALTPLRHASEPKLPPLAWVIAIGHVPSATPAFSHDRQKSRS